MNTLLRKLSSMQIFHINNGSLRPLFQILFKALLAFFAAYNLAFYSSIIHLCFVLITVKNFRSH